MSDYRGIIDQCIDSSELSYCSSNKFCRTFSVFERSEIQKTEWALAIQIPRARKSTAPQF